MVELFPRVDNEIIQIKLSHRGLADLPQCAALSYEWGSPDRNHDVLCNGKVLIVTSNLYAALESLRCAASNLEDLRTEESPPSLKWLWIDAICINQEDIIERGHQITLMRPIFTRTG